jgi:hypothetical protein
MHQDLMEQLPSRHPGILATTIPYASEVERMGLHRMPVAAYAPSNPAAAAYGALWDEVKRVLS